MNKYLINNFPEMKIKYICITIFLLIPFYKPDCVAVLQIPIIEYCYALSEIFVAVLVIYKLFKDFKIKNSIDEYNICIIGTATIILLSTILNDQSIRNWLGRWAPRVVVVLLAMYAMKKRPIEFIFGSTLLVSGFCIVNLFTVILFPEGLYQTASTFAGDNYFLGHRNGTAVYLFQMLAGSLILENIKSKTLIIGPLTIILYLVALMQTILAFCATTLISLMIMASLVFLVRLKRVRRIFSPYFALILSVIGNFSIVLGRVHEAFAPIIQVVLHRDLTLSNRTIIWDKTLNMLHGWNALLGRGVDGHNQIIIGQTVISSAHNDLLNIALQGGLISLLLYCGAYCYIACRISKMHRAPIQLSYSIILIPLVILSIAYPVASVPTFLMLSLFYYLPIREIDLEEQ